MGTSVSSEAADAIARELRVERCALALFEVITGEDHGRD
jgi:hypothetical protein